MDLKHLHRQTCHYPDLCWFMSSVYGLLTFYLLFIWFIFLPYAHLMVFNLLSKPTYTINGTLNWLWTVSLNSSVFVHELSGCGFESRCSCRIDTLLNYFFFIASFSWQHREKVKMICLFMYRIQRLKQPWKITDGSVILLFSTSIQ